MPVIMTRSTPKCAISEPVKGRQKHAEHVKLNDGRSAGEFMMVSHHRDRRCRHREDHDAVAGCRAEQRHQIFGLCHDGAPPSTASIVGLRSRFRNPQPKKHGRADHRDCRQQKERADIGLGEQMAAEPTQLGTGEGRDDAAAKNPGDGTRTEAIIRHFAGGEAIELGERLMGAD
jgi:hypothetical protein